MTERELHLKILRAVKTYQDSNNGAHIPFENLAAEVGMEKEQLQKQLRNLKNLDAVRYTQDDKTFEPILVEISRNGINRLKG
jgi:RIO-like serine/threonine protein kinase